MAPKVDLHDPINHQKLYDHLKANCRDLLVDYQLRILLPRAILHSFIDVTFPHTRRDPKELKKKGDEVRSYLLLKKNIDANKKQQELNQKSAPSPHHNNRKSLKNSSMSYFSAHYADLQIFN